MLTTPNATIRLARGEKPWNRFHIREYFPDDLNGILKHKFSEVDIFGISAKEEIKKIEAERIKQGLKMISLDPFKIRKILPVSFRLKIMKIMKRFMGKDESPKGDYSFRQKYDLADFFVIKNSIETSLDLLAICRK